MEPRWLLSGLRLQLQQLVSVGGANRDVVTQAYREVSLLHWRYHVFLFPWCSREKHNCSLLV